MNSYRTSIFINFWFIRRLEFLVDFVTCATILANEVQDGDEGKESLTDWFEKWGNSVGLPLFFTNWQIYLQVHTTFSHNLGNVVKQAATWLCLWTKSAGKLICWDTPHSTSEVLAVGHVLSVNALKTKLMPLTVAYMSSIPTPTTWVLS